MIYGLGMKMSRNVFLLLLPGERKSEGEEKGLCLISLIIPIIMAWYENVINNTEDTVVAISHMVVGPRSVTILPLASTYVCQTCGPTTGSGSAHLAPA